MKAFKRIEDLATKDLSQLILSLLNTRDALEAAQAVHNEAMHEKRVAAERLREAERFVRETNSSLGQAYYHYTLAKGLYGQVAHNEFKVGDRVEYHVPQYDPNSYTDEVVARHELATVIGHTKTRIRIMLDDTGRVCAVSASNLVKAG